MVGYDVECSAYEDLRRPRRLGSAIRCPIAGLTVECPALDRNYPRWVSAAAIAQIEAGEWVTRQGQGRDSLGKAEAVAAMQRIRIEDFEPQVGNRRLSALL